MTDRGAYKPRGEIEALPCLTKAAIRRLEALVMSEDVWEFGSGGSTLWLAARVKSLVSIEDDPDWYIAVRQALVEQGLEADLRLSPTKTLPDAITGAGMFGVVFVDCLTQKERQRSIVLGSRHVKAGSWLVADDYDFPLTHKAVEGLRGAGWDVSIVSGTKVHPRRNVVVKTSTAFCQRPGG